MKVLRIVLVIACCVLSLEVGLATVALRSKAKARNMLHAMDQFSLGAASKAEVESKLRELGLVPLEEPCSASAGPCQGIGVELANYPETSHRTIAPILEFVAAKMSVFRPTYLVANLYFYSDRLESATVTFSTDQASIGTTLASVKSGQGATSEWRQSNRTGNATFVRVLDRAHQQGASLRAGDIFDLGCIESFRGCNTALALWPSMSQYKADQ